MLDEFKINVPVLVIFYNRSNTLIKTFDSIRRAKPSVLLLWQDGPRNNTDVEIMKIQECRKIVSSIDWDCQVYTNFNEQNYGCDPSTFLAQKWAFSLVDKCIVLEDDMVADESFFYFCKELLDRYENDNRINHICGINFLEVSSDCVNDYLFSYNGTGAWASWKRVIDGWDQTYSFLDDDKTMKSLKNRYRNHFNFTYELAQKRRKEGKVYWETILGFDCMLNNRLVIIPKHNLVSNIGVTEDATHSSKLKLMNKKISSLFYMKIYQQTFPLKHPKYFVNDEEYQKKVDRITGFGNPIIKLSRKIEYILKCIIYGEVSIIQKAIVKRIEKLRL